jgi:D-glycero-D-manno-heptose 1,7-bisphosphate phosphatase
MNSAVFLDRDGVINRKPPEGQYVTRWEDVELLPGVAEGIALLNRAGFRVIVVTNQRCVAKGLITAIDLEELHRKMSEVLERSGATVHAFYYCPHDIDAGCGCRKPAPGMLLDAARSAAIDLRTSWMIGDSDSDVEAGHRAGCRTVRLVEVCDSIAELGRDGAGESAAEIVAPTLREAIRQIMGRVATSPSPAGRVSA